MTMEDIASIRILFVHFLVDVGVTDLVTLFVIIGVQINKALHSFLVLNTLLWRHQIWFENFDGSTDIIIEVLVNHVGLSHAGARFNAVTFKFGQ